MKRLNVLIFSFLVWSVSAQETFFDFDQARSTAVFQDVGGGVRESVFPVTGNLQSIIFLVAFQAGNPVIEFVSPDNRVLGLDSPLLAVQRAEWGVTIGLKQPSLGTWTLRLSRTLGESSYQVKVFSVPAVPTVQLLTPAFAMEPWSSPMSIDGSTQPDQAGKRVVVYLTEGTEETGGIIAGETTVQSDGRFHYILSPQEFAQGEYHVTVSLEDDVNPSVKAKAVGTLDRRTPPRLTAVPKPVFLVEQPDTLTVFFDNPFGRLPTTFRVHVRDASGAEIIRDLGTQTKGSLSGFKAGRGEAWITAVDAQGLEGDASVKTTVLFDSTPDIPPVLSLLQSTVNTEVAMGKPALRVRFGLSGPFVPRGGSVDYVEPLVGGLPAGLQLMPLRSTWYLPTESGLLDFEVSATNEVVPGTYPLDVGFRTVGSPETLVVGTLVVTVFRPQPLIVAVRPDAWQAAQSPLLEVSGQNFGAGTRVFVDDVEFPLVELNPDTLKLKIPASLSTGEHRLKVQVSETSAESIVNVYSPSYSLLSLKTVSKVKAGGRARFWLGLKALNGFTGSGTILAAGPEAWAVQANPSVLGDGETSIVSVDVPAAAVPGDYHATLTTGEGGQIDLLVTVVNEAPAPFLSSLSSYSELAGGPVTLYGYGFGTLGGQIVVDGQTWPTTLWTEDEIRLSVPATAKTGLLRVRIPDGRISNGITFGVKDYGFQYHTNQLVFSLQGGDNRSFDVQLTGYKQGVALSVQSLSPLIQAYLDPPIVTPTGLFKLILAVDKNIPAGSYSVNLSGTSGLYNAGLALTVQIGKALEFTTTSLPTAMLGANFSARLSAVNGEGTMQYQLADGALPAGTKLGADGLISGRASQTGAFRIVVAVSDQDGHRTTKEFTVNVEESAWVMAGRDEGGSNYSPLDSPADGRTLWTSAALGSNLALLSGSGNVFLQTIDGLSAVYGPKGTLLFRIPGVFADWRYSQGRLVALGSDGVLHSYESGFGNEVWRREGVSRFWVRSGTVLTQTSEGVLRLDAAEGTLFDTKATADLTGSLVGWQGDLYRLNGKALERWNDADGWQPQHQNALQDWRAAFADGEALFLIDQTGKIFRWNGSAATLLWTGAAKHMVVGSDWLAADTGTGIEIRDRVDGHLIRQWTGGGYDNLLAGREKLFAIGGGVLKALNRTSGAVIWQAPASDAILSGDRIYSVDAQGVVKAYHAPDNLKAPTTNLVTLPLIPNGTNGWFTVRPTLSLVATDPETYAASTTWKVGAAEWEAYEPKTLADGVFSLAWHSIDTKGLQEADRMAAVSVDTAAPTTQLQNSANPLPSLPNVYAGPVTLNLVSADALSGLARIEYRFDTGAWLPYTKSLTLSEQKSYPLTYRGVDQAGNVEAIRSFPFFLDFQDPVASAETDAQDQAVFVKLSGSDTGTGLARLEYKINEGPVQPYLTLIGFTTTGKWTLAYRAVDNAGRTSVWKTLQVQNTGPSADDRISKIEYHKDVKGREVENSVAVGDAIFSNSKEKFLALPPELVGGLYLRNRDTDAQITTSSYTTLTFSGPVTVYYLQESDSKAVLTGWSKGALIPAGTINKTYFKGGLQLWSKSYQGGEKAILPSPALKHTGGDLVFVQAPWLGVTLVRPAEGTALSSGQSVTLQALTGPVNAEVTWTLGSRGQTALGKGNPLTVTLPELSGREVELTATITVSGKSYQAQASYDVTQPEKLSILYPNGLFPVKTGVPLKPVTLWRDSQGRVVPAPAVTWTLKKGTQQLYQGASPIPVNTTGPLTLIGTATGAGGRTITATTTFNTVGDWPWVKWKWKDKGHKEWRDDDGEGFWGDPRADDDRREGQFGSRKATLDVWKWTKDADYRLSVGDGTYEIQLVVGPFKAWEVHSLLINEQALNFTAKKNGEVLRLKFTAQAIDGVLSIKGTAGLPLYRLDYRRIGDNAPLSASLDKTIDTPEELE